MEIRVRKISKPHSAKAGKYHRACSGKRVPHASIRTKRAKHKSNSYWDGFENNLGVMGKRILTVILLPVIFLCNLDDYLDDISSKMT